MHIPVPWAIALATAAAMLVVVVLAVATRRSRGAAEGRTLVQAAYLMAGGLTGFVALAFPPAWPLLVFTGWMLGASAVRAGRPGDLGLFLAGAGATWTLLLGTRIVADIADPAIHGSELAVAWLAASVVVLIGGVAIALRASHAPGDGAGLRR